MEMAALGRLRRGLSVTDEAFDRCLPRRARALSGAQWTPVRVARRAAELLVTKPGARVLDVGSGVGKFCVIGALTTAGRFTGVEQRARLVEVARALVRAGRIPRCAFKHGNATDLDWNGYDGIYLYNPFAEHLITSARQDDSIRYGLDTYRLYVERVEYMFANLRPGVRVVTYHGFGGTMTDHWRTLPVASRPDHLELWTNVEASAPAHLQMSPW
jgi:SAM-dependent methyltransferase